ncbi:serine/threonine-protein phosphatase 6 regulatory subunit 3 isoform X2 [Prorops nasuta]|uniref:serine/threonine-protein phosphatase 6 regulatory subunit 3 isoform X2 n=1 Tax=Prorops nasuta TaxID=863751 RepID=UPI0034CF6F12
MYFKNVKVKIRSLWNRDEALLAKLYSFIDTDQPLNPLLASFFSKIIGVLVARKSEQNWYSYQFTCIQVVEFLKSRQKCVDLLLQHLETSAIMDLVLKLVTQVEGNDIRQNTLNWLDSQQLVQRLVKLLSPASDPAKHANAAQLLCDILTMARENQDTSTERTDADPILDTLESEETVGMILGTILLGEKVESSIVGGIQVLLALLGPKSTSASKKKVYLMGDVLRSNERRTSMMNATIGYLAMFHKLLLDPPYKPPVKTTAGALECPLGNTRLHVTKLLVTLLSAENVRIHESLAYQGIFQTLLDLFFKYSWNNFLHTQVQQCLALAINCDYQGADSIIYANIFVKGKLIDRIIEAWETNENKEDKEKNRDSGNSIVRQGYMGHLIKIANNIVSQCEKSYTFDRFLKKNLSFETLSKWEKLVSTQLEDINKTHHLLLSSQTSVYITNSEENPDEYNSYSNPRAFQQDTFVDQMYSNYQRQQMTPQFIDNFGYCDNEFTEREKKDTLHSSVEQLTTLGFNLSEEDLDKRKDIFNKICKEKQIVGLEFGSADVEWGNGSELSFQKVFDKRLPDWPHNEEEDEEEGRDEQQRKEQQELRENDSNSSDDDDDEETDDDPQDIQMEIDATDPWNTGDCTSTNAVTTPTTTLPEIHPWGAPSEPAESTGWANFDHFENTLNLDNSSTVRDSSNQDGFENNDQKVEIATNVNVAKPTPDEELPVTVVAPNNAIVEAREITNTTTTAITTSSVNEETNLHSQNNDEGCLPERGIASEDDNANSSGQPLNERRSDCTEKSKSNDDLDNKCSKERETSSSIEQQTTVAAPLNNETTESIAKSHEDPK